MPDP